MNFNAYAQHPDDPATLLVRAREYIAELITRPDIHTVIWQRGLKDSYTKLFNRKAADIAAYHDLALRESFDYGTAIYLDDHNEPESIITGAPNDVIEDVKRLLPTRLWKDLKLMAQMISHISKEKDITYMHLFDEPGQYIVERTGEWHHDKAITAHMTVNDAVLELLNITGDELKTKVKIDGRDNCFRDAVLPPECRIILPETGDIVFFKRTVHRKSLRTAENGRCGFSLFRNPN